MARNLHPLFPSLGHLRRRSQSRRGTIFKMVEISLRRDSGQSPSGKAISLCITAPLSFPSQKNSATPISVRHPRLRLARQVHLQRSFLLERSSTSHSQFVPYRLETIHIFKKLNLPSQARERTKIIHKISRACDRRQVFPESPAYKSKFLPATSKLFSSQLLPSSSLEREKIIPAQDRHCGHVRTVLASQFGGILLLSRAFLATDIAHTAKVGPSTGT
jgi:hypothetical protein